MSECDEVVRFLEARCPQVAVKVEVGLTPRFVVSGFNGKGERVLRVGGATAKGARAKFADEYDKAVGAGLLAAKAKGE